MNEFLVTLRSNTTGLPVHVHICNIDSEQQAIALASNSLLIDDECTFESLYSIKHQSPDFIPF